MQEKGVCGNKLNLLTKTIDKMNKLDLNAYGVEEMSNAEMRETEGGIGAVLLMIGIIGTIAAIFELL